MNTFELSNEKDNSLDDKIKIIFHDLENMIEDDYDRFREEFGNRYCNRMRIVRANIIYISNQIEEEELNKIYRKMNNDYKFFIKKRISIPYTIKEEFVNLLEHLLYIKLYGVMEIALR